MHVSSEKMSLQALPAELIAVVLEQLPFSTLLAAYRSCWHLRSASREVTRILIDQIEHLTVPLVRPFGPKLLCLEVENATSQWLPRLACVLGVLPKLRRLFLRRARTPLGVTSFSDASIMALAGAFQARPVQANLV